HRSKEVVFKKDPFVRTAFAILMPDISQKTFSGCRDRMLSLLHPFERARHWKRTQIYTGDELSIKPRKPPGSAALVIGSTCWVNNPFFLYIYLAVFKGFYKNLATGMEEIRKAKTLQRYFDMLESRSSMFQYKNASLWLDVIKDRRRIFKDFSVKDMAVLYEHEDMSGPKEAAYGFGIYELVRNRAHGNGMISSKTKKNMRGVMKKWLTTKKK
ncbi:MAG: hypothetical protein DRO87_11655, partial [Candidatus Thorarchaeota archaeon]